MSAKDLHDLGVAQLAAKLAAREVSSVEVTQHFLARIGQQDSLGAFLATDAEVSLAQAHKAFTAEGRIADGQLQQRFDTNIINFMDLVEASTHYPCVKRAWVEYLGEHPEPALDRVE